MVRDDQQPAAVGPTRWATSSRTARTATHALLAAYDDAHASFVAALEAADPAEPAHSWSGDPANHTVAFTYRRQAHEALIHRLDAELAAGAVTPLDTALAADGVDEALDWMYGNLPPWGSFDPLPQYVEFRMDGRGHVGAGPSSASSRGRRRTARSSRRRRTCTSYPTPAVPADVVVTGARPGASTPGSGSAATTTGSTVTGDPAVYEHAREVLDQPID